MLLKFILVVAANTAAVWFMQSFLSGFSVSGIESAIIFAVALTTFNFLIVPIVKFFAFPLNIITLGLVGILINLSVVYAAEWLVDGVNITAENIEYYIHLVIISTVTSVISGFLK